MSTQNVVNFSAEQITASVETSKSKGLPPVHSWNPPFIGNMDMRIAKDGTWFHEGAPIRRVALVKLFSSILRKDGDAYFLVTPVEKVGITVEDAPFVAVDMNVESQGTLQRLTFTTHVGDTVIADADHPIRIVSDHTTDAPAPYVLVRDRLEALIDRKTFYRLVDLGCEDDGHFGVWSCGTFFPFAKAD